MGFIFKILLVLVISVPRNMSEFTCYFEWAQWEYCDAKQQYIINIDCLVYIQKMESFQKVILNVCVIVQLRLMFVV